MTVSPTRPAASSRIWPSARRRVASNVTAISRMQRRNSSGPPDGKAFPTHQNACFGNWFPGRRKVLRAPKRRSAGGLARKILFEPVDVVVAIDNGGVAHQRPEQRQRGLGGLQQQFFQTPA